MSDAFLCFRTVTRVEIFRQVKIGGLPALVPIAMAVPPQKVSINPGDSIDEAMEVAKDGRMVVGLTYPKEAKAELELEFSMTVAELESIIHGRVVKLLPNKEGFVQAEFRSDFLPPARIAGEIGFGVVDQVMATTTAEAYYIDPITKLAVPITIKGASDTLVGDQMTIGAAMAFTVSEALAAKGVEIKAWVPQVFPASTGLSAEPIGRMTVFAQGVSFDNTARLMKFRNCGRLAGGAANSEPTRSIKLRILADAADGTGLGYSQFDVPLQTA